MCSSYSSTTSSTLNFSTFIHFWRTCKSVGIAESIGFRIGWPDNVFAANDVGSICPHVSILHKSGLSTPNEEHSVGSNGFGVVRFVRCRINANEGRIAYSLHLRQHRRKRLVRHFLFRQQSMHYFSDRTNQSFPDATHVTRSLEYYRGSARPGSNEVIHVKLRKRKSARFEPFGSFMFLCD